MKKDTSYKFQHFLNELINIDFKENLLLFFFGPNEGHF